MSIKLGANVVPQFKLGIINLNKIMLGAIEIFPNLAPSGGFDPSDFFTGLDDGVFYNYSDITSIFQDPAGAVPITAGGQTIGLVNDLKGVGTPINIPQNTAAARPLADSRYNIQLHSEDISNAAYRKTGITVTPAPVGTFSGGKGGSLITNDGSANHYFDNYPTAYGTISKLNASLFFKNVDGSNLRVAFAPGGGGVDINLTTMVTTIRGTNTSNVLLDDLGNGEYRISFDNDSFTINAFNFLVVNLDPDVASSASCYITGCQTSLAYGLRPYQWVTDAANYNWQLAALGARFDTVDDVMTSAAFSLAGDVRTMCLAVEWLPNQSGVAAFANHGYTAFGPGMGITGQSQNAYNVEGTSGGNRATSPPNYPPANRASVIAINEPLVPYIEIQVNGLKTSNNNVQGGVFIQNVPFSIGRGQGFNDPANCRIIAVLLINRLLTDTEQQQWNTWAYNLLDITP
jgi:hypothetical protein